MSQEDPRDGSKSHCDITQTGWCVCVGGLGWRLTWPNISGNPSTWPVKTPRQMKMELNWPMQPRIWRGEISPRYMGRALRATPV